MGMTSFSKLDKVKPNSQNKDKLVYKDFAIEIYDYDDYRFLKQKDGVICIPYLIELNQIILRQEYIPPYKYVDGHDYHLHLVGGGIEIGESPEIALLRELQEEAGLVLRDNFLIEFDRPLFVAKHCAARYFPCILPLNENDYHEVVIRGDGTKFEQMSQTVKVDIKYLNSLVSSDAITELMLEKFKRYMNI